MLLDLITLLIVSLLILGGSLVLSWILRHIHRAVCRVLWPPPAYPHCGACRYDLRGGPAEESRCPECGAVQGGALAEAERITPRQPVLGLGLIVLALSPFIVGQICEATGNRYRLTPDWIVHDLVFGFGSEPISEMKRRLRAGTVGQKRVDGMLERGLAWQERVSDGGYFDFWMTVDPNRTVRSSMTFARETDWPQLLEAAVMAGYAGTEQHERFIRNSLVIDIYSLGPGSIAVQVISLIGPETSAAMTVDARERETAAAAYERFPASSATTWNWRFDAAGQPEGPAVIQWRIDASAALAVLGIEEGEMTGEIEIDWPGPETGMGPVLLKSLRPLGDGR